VEIGNQVAQRWAQALGGKELPVLAQVWAVEWEQELALILAHSRTVETVRRLGQRGWAWTRWIRLGSSLMTSSICLSLFFVISGLGFYLSPRLSLCTARLSLYVPIFVHTSPMLSVLNACGWFFVPTFFFLCILCNVCLCSATDDL
jgi:hypothetical protein